MADSAKKIESFNTSNIYNSDSIRDIEKRNSQELIIGLCGAIGSGVKTLKNQKKAQSIPLLLIINKNNKAEIPPEVTHILLKPFDIADFINILQQYEQKEQNFADNELFYVENAKKQQDLPGLLR